MRRFYMHNRSMYWDESGTHNGEWCKLADCLEALEDAWTLIANAHGGDWSKASPEWKEAAERWRDQHWNEAIKHA